MRCVIRHFAKLSLLRRLKGQSMMTKPTLVLTLASAMTLSFGIRAQQAPTDGPRYTSGTNLARPTDYREWPFVGSSLGLAYTPLPEGAPPPFTNVFVNPS